MGEASLFTAAREGPAGPMSLYTDWNAAARRTSANLTTDYRTATIIK